MAQNSYQVLKAFELPNGEKAEVGSAVTLTQQQAKYLLLGGKIEAAQAAVQKKTDAKAAEPKGGKQ